MNRLILVLLLIVGMGCSSKKVLQKDNGVSKAGVIKVSANWVKDKGKKFDIEFVIENIGDKGIIVDLNDIQCARGKRTGSVKHTFFNTGERTIDLRGGQMKIFGLVCNIGTKAGGPFNMRITKVYHNPGDDGSSRGKVVAKNIVWSTPAIK